MLLSATNQSTEAMKLLALSRYGRPWTSGPDRRYRGVLDPRLVPLERLQVESVAERPAPSH
jgi:hypothetical protein